MSNLRALVRGGIPDWHLKAACAGKDDLMFPDKGQRLIEQEAKRVCRNCPVALECLRESVDLGDFHGIRAGFNGRERELIAVGAEPSNCDRCNGFFVAQWPNQVRCRHCSQAVRGAA